MGSSSKPNQFTMNTEIQEKPPRRVAHDPADAVLARLRAYVEAEEFAGYDPYDALTGWPPLHWGGRWTQAVATQIHKRNPVNLRPVMGIRKRRNPKAIGLFLSGYSRWAMADENQELRSVARELFDWLLANRSEGFSGLCWGYPFDWVNPIKRVAAGVPSVVVTAFVARGIFDYFELSGDKRARDAIFACCRYVTENLPRTETPAGLCFSYTHLHRDCCYNANMLAAEILASGAALGGSAEWGDLARQALAFTVAHQHADGRWNYSLDPVTKQERVQIDFHQGFLLDSIDRVRRLLGDIGSESLQALERGAAFYRREQFFPSGRAKWRLPKEWPADIHNQAQGILSFSRLRHLEPDYAKFARIIARWTIRHMYSVRGYFCYQLFPVGKNRIPYMRWGQAWMFLALVELSAARKSLLNQQVSE